MLLLPCRTARDSRFLGTRGPKSIKRSTGQSARFGVAQGRPREKEARLLTRFSTFQHLAHLFNLLKSLRKELRACKWLEGLRFRQRTGTGQCVACVWFASGLALALARTGILRANAGKLKVNSPNEHERPTTTTSARQAKLSSGTSPHHLRLTIKGPTWLVLAFF